GSTTLTEAGRVAEPHHWHLQIPGRRYAAPLRAFATTPDAHARRSSEISSATVARDRREQTLRRRKGRRRDYDAWATTFFARAILASCERSISERSACSRSLRTRGSISRSFRTTQP